MSKPGSPTPLDLRQKFGVRREHCKRLNASAHRRGVFRSGVGAMTMMVRWSGQGEFERFASAIATLGSGRVAAIGNRAVNRAGDQSRTQVRRALTRQTGLKRVVIVKAVRATRSTAGTLTYSMRSEGGDVALRFFAARETRKGVSAAPFGQRRIFDGAFIKGGRFPTRVDIGRGGHVFERAGAARLPIERQKSGVSIPAEMVRGATADVFTSTVERVLPQRLAHEISRATKGVIG